MTMAYSRNSKGEYVMIPPWEWEKGCKVDWENNRLIGVSGTVYENIQLSLEDLKKAFPEIFQRH